MEETLNMLSMEEVKMINEWLARYDKDHSIWEEGFGDCRNILGSLDEYGTFISRDLIEYDTYKGWFKFKSIWKLNGRYFACEYFENAYESEVEDFYEVEKKEYTQRIQVTEWVKRS